MRIRLRFGTNLLGCSIAVAVCASAFAQTPAAKRSERAMCDGKPVLMVVDGRTNDRVRMQAYTKRLLESGLYAALGGYYLNSPKAIDSFEGATAANHATLIVRFPCLRNARTFWYSKVYQNGIKPLRLDPLAGDFTVRIYSESAPPDWMTGKVGDNRYTTEFPGHTISVIPTAKWHRDDILLSPSIRRTTLVVADLERALKLYRDVLGFTVNDVRPLPSNGSGFAIFGLNEHEPVRFATLSAGDEQREALGLLEVPSYRQPSTQSVRSAALVIKTPVPLSDIPKKIRGAEGQALAPSSAGNNLEQALIDADGHLIVLYEAK